MRKQGSTVYLVVDDEDGRLLVDGSLEQFRRLLDVLRPEREREPEQAEAERRQEAVQC